MAMTKPGGGTAADVAALMDGRRVLGVGAAVALNVLGLNLLGTLLEGIGISILLPVFQFIQAGGQLEKLMADSQLWQTIVAGYARVGLPVNLAVLLATGFLAILGRQICTYFRVVYAMRMQRAITRDVRNRAFARYLRTSLAYQERTALGDVVNDLTTELDRAVVATFGAINIVGNVLLVLAYFALLLPISPVMTGSATVLIAVAVLMLQGVIRPSRAVGDMVAVANRDASTFLVDRLRATRLIRLSGSAAAEEAEMRRRSEQQYQKLYHTSVIGARVGVLIEPIVVAFALIFLYVGVTRFAFDIGVIGLFFVVMGRLVPVVKDGMRMWQVVLSSLGSVDAVRRRLESIDGEREKLTGGRPFIGLARGIEFRGVSFAYPGASDAPALEGVDLVIEAGRMTALVGPSGAGKSTLVDMIPRLREPIRGQILIDGTPATEVSMASLRDGIAYAPQVPQIFDVTPAEHIRYDRPEVAMEQVVRAARLAGAHDFITALPKGYDTRLGEGGIRLSGGQRQRLDLARALAKGAAIVILDEPTSNLDAEAEQALRSAFARIRRESSVTLVIIGHRLSTVSGADRIITLMGGRVAEIGTHDELVCRGGWYAQALKQQRDSLADPARVALMESGR
ncbi:MAG: ABC transporter ATP-binding protein [Alphaproteobacteria bacterium]|nr:ABC transporter ATP-binding protein [Alphaproteobacteria bacterium]